MIRWLHLLRYPDGADKEEGEEWYLGTHVGEAKRMAELGLARYQSWQGLKSPYDSPTYPREKLNRWDRVTELCFTDWEAFRDATASNAGRYTPPPFESTFVGGSFESHMIFLNDEPQYDFLSDGSPSSRGR
jgi:hypothetical protein